MTMRERIKALAKEKGMSLPDLEQELGFGSGTIVKWDKCAPRSDKLQIVANYFGVTIDYLMTGFQPVDDADINAMLADPEYRALFKRTAKMSKTDLDFVKRMINSIQIDE